MTNLSKSSIEKLNQCHPELQRLFLAVGQEWECAIICGHRNKIDQDHAFLTGHSKKQWPNGAHNKLPSNAVDAAPLKVNGDHEIIDWNDKTLFYEFAKFVKQKAIDIGFKGKLIWGGDWKTLVDLPHFERRET